MQRSHYYLFYFVLQSVVVVVVRTVRLRRYILIFLFLQLWRKYLKNLTNRVGRHTSRRRLVITV